MVLLATAILVVAGAQRCDESTAPDRAEEVRIELAVSGGFAGVDWLVTIDGAAGRIVGERCRRALDCDWSEGEVLATVEPERLLVLARRFADEGFLALPRSDYGTECCDQFEYSLTYVDGDDQRTVTGSDGTLPGSAARL
ncbi:MAG: hypothetical protein ACRELC_05320, partial [Gemmatimonadota bacterium]